MRVGLDFGTTHTVVAAVDRGNYPVVAFEGGDALPSVVAARRADGALRFGDAALAVADDPDWEVLRSVKRQLHAAGPQTAVDLAGHAFPLGDLLTGYLVHVRDALRRRSNLGLARGERLEAAVSVPANASSAQRFLTLDAFRRAGFDVVACVNEPSAAAFEYGHRHGRTLTSRREHVVVYDLGGGTFDASLLRMAGRRNEVLATSGIARLGGDDVDAAIAGLVRERAALGDLDAHAAALLVDECRRQKEALTPNSRRLVVDLAALGHEPVALPIDDVWTVCQPLVEQSLAALESLVGRPDDGGGSANVGWGEIAGIYVVGGGSALPLVGRLLRERWGTSRVKRSPHPFAATAIGLAVLLDADAGWALADRLGRHFGVWREADRGAHLWFDPIFPKDTPLPKPGEPPLEAARRYPAAHNLGHYRFVECGRVADGLPDCELLPWTEVRFPFEPGLRAKRRLDQVPVLRLEGEGPTVEERYRLGADGVVQVTLELPQEGFRRTFTLAREADHLGARDD
jgi:molecular chaperone DnaK